jgi:hypothetical protein
MSDDSRLYTIDTTTYIYHKIKNDILLNPIGIITTPTTMIASPERALCDMLYLYPKMSVENIDILDRNKLLIYIDIYPKTTFLALQRLLNGSQS